MFVTEIDRLLRQDHAEDYCGIVYADDLQQPRFIKIYDPNNLGVSCGYSSKTKKDRVNQTRVADGSRFLFGGG